MNRNVSIFCQEIEANQALLNPTSHNQKWNEQQQIDALKRHQDEIMALKDEVSRLKMDNEANEKLYSDLSQHIEVCNSTTMELIASKQSF